ATAVLRAGEADLLADRPQQGRARVDGDVVRFTVDRQSGHKLLPGTGARTIDDERWEGKGWLEQLDGIADRNPAWLDHVGVERQASSHLLRDAAQDGRILLERVGIVGGHDAAAAQLLERD